MTQQARNLSFTGLLERMHFLIHDRDSKFAACGVRVGFANSGGLVFMDDSTEEIASQIYRVRDRLARAVGESGETDRVPA